MVDFGEINLSKKSFINYKQFNENLYQKVISASSALKNKKIVHINSTENGGGVAELLISQVALERNLGLDSHWYVIHPPKEFFVITKKIHNLLQGEDSTLDDVEQNYYLEKSKKVGDELDYFLNKEKVNLVITHDPQPLLIGCCNLLPRVPKILRLHIDLTNPNQETLFFLKPFIEVFDKVIVSRDDFRFPWLKLDKVKTIMPAIDPLAAKNLQITDDEAWEILSRFGVRRKMPLISQISRFDKWKDPIGVIEAFKAAKEEIDNLQLVLLGLIESVDDPEAKAQVNSVLKAAKDIPDILIFYDENQLKGIANDNFVRALQTASDVILQKSLKEGFGLTVSEAMWKGKAVIGGNVGGIKMQIKNGEDGFLVDSIKETASKIVELINNKAFREIIGRRAQKTVASKFLMPRYLLDNLEVYNKVLKIKNENFN